MQAMETSPSVTMFLLPALVVNWSRVRAETSSEVKQKILTHSPTQFKNGAIFLTLIFPHIIITDLFAYYSIEKPTADCIFIMRCPSRH